MNFPRPAAGSHNCTTWNCSINITFPDFFRKTWQWLIRHSSLGLTLRDRLRSSLRSSLRDRLHPRLVPADLFLNVLCFRRWCRRISSWTSCDVVQLGIFPYGLGRGKRYSFFTLFFTSDFSYISIVFASSSMNVVGNHAPHGRSVLVTPRALTWYYNVMIMTMFYLLLFVVIPLNFIISQLTPDGLDIPNLGWGYPDPSFVLAMMINDWLCGS